MEFTAQEEHEQQKDNGRLTEEEAESSSFSAQFWSHFSSRQEDISSSLSQATVSPEDLSAAKTGISELQEFITSSAVDLPKYDLRRSQEEVNKLKKTVETIGNSVQPKKKFSFSSRSKSNNKKNVEKLPSCDQKDTKASVTNSTVASRLLAGKSICIKDRTDEPAIDLTDEVAADKGYQVYVENCKNCKISVRTVFGSARLENLQNCHIYLGPCCTSTYVENCTGCIFFIQCHQLRIHHAYDSHFYVYVNSHPIIEDCTTLRFSPYSAFYTNLQKDVEVAKLASAKNWDNVVDFRWHRTTASPNWSVMSLEDRMKSTEMKGWEIVSIEGDVDVADDEEF